MKKLSRSLLLLAVTAVMFFAMSVTAMAAIAPTDVAQQETSLSGNILVSWTNVDGYSYYGIQVATDANFSNIVVTEYGLGSLGYQYVSGLSQGSTYYVRVGCGTSSSTCYQNFSEAVEMVTAPASGASDLTQSNATSTSITLSWSAVSGATGYCIVSGDTTVADVTGTTVTISQTTGTYVSYKVYPYREATSTGFKAEYSSYSSVYAYTCPSKVSDVASASAGNIEWSPKTNKITVGWSRNKNDDYIPDGFVIQVYDVKGSKKLKTYTMSKSYTYSYTFKLAKIKNKGCQIRIAPYVTINGTKYYGEWSKKVVVLPQAKITALTQKNAKTLKISWKKVSNASNYIIYYKKTYSGKWKKLKKVSGKLTSYTTSKLSSGNTYYFYVVPVVKVGKKKYTAKFSTVTYASKFMWTSSIYWD